MKKILVILLMLLCVNSTAWADSRPAQPAISVVVFIHDIASVGTKAVAEKRSILKEKFPQAKSIAIYDDDQAKSPEFLEFTEKIKPDLENAKFVWWIGIDALAQYGKATNSDYVILVRLIKNFAAEFTVIDVASAKYVEALLYFKNNPWAEKTNDLITKIALHWSSPQEEPVIKQPSVPAREKRPAVILLLPSIILEKSDLAESVRKTVMEKFKVSEVPIFIDDRPKSAAFLNFISGVKTDTAKQQTFVLKKERLAEYGNNTNSNPVIAIDVDIVSMGSSFIGFSYRLKETIFVVDAEEKKYLASAVYDTLDEKSARAGVDFLMDKLKNEFKLP